MHMVNVLFYKRTRQTIKMTKLFGRQRLLWKIYFPLTVIEYLQLNLPFPQITRMAKRTKIADDAIPAYT